MSTKLFAALVDTIAKNTKKRTLDDYYPHQPANKRRKLMQNDVQISSDSEDLNNNTDEKLQESCMDISKLKGIEHKWEDNATVLYYEKFLDKTRAKRLFDELIKLNYEQTEWKLFGKTGKTPRLQC